MLVEAGMPKGVINIVSGFGATAGAAIAKHPKIEKVAFTGSTATGKIIMKLAAESNLKKVTLELGGKSPNIVFNDADLDKTIQNLIVSIFYNSGEVCCAGSRLLIQSGVYDQVVEKFKEAAESVKVGNPFDEDTFMGAQVSDVQLSKILKYVESGKSQGATVVTGGARADGKGYFVKPTIFADVKKDMDIVREEIFGPVVTLIKFDTVDEAVELANDSDYGLLLVFTLLTLTNVLMWPTELKPVLFGSTLITISTQWFHSEDSVLQVSVEKWVKKFCMNTLKSEL